MSKGELFEKEWFINSPWGKICIVAWGHCENPPILVVHGERDSLASFRPLMKYLPNQYYYVGMELPGQGRSDPFPHGLPVTAWDLVYSLEVVRSHFRWDQFMYMTHSFAGTIARLYNFTHPGRVIGAIEFDQITRTLTWPVEDIAAWYHKGHTSYFEKYDLYNPTKDTAPKYTWDEAITKVLEYRDLTPEQARATIERWSKPAGKGLIRFTFDQRSKWFVRPPFTPQELKTIYTSLKTPTLGIVAEHSIKRGLYTNTPFLLHDGENYVVRKVCGGHDVHIKHPDRVALFVCQYLKYGLSGLDRRAKL